MIGVSKITPSISNACPLLFFSGYNWSDLFDFYALPCKDNRPTKAACFCFSYKEKFFKSETFLPFFDLFKQTSSMFSFVRNKKNS